MNVAQEPGGGGPQYRPCVLLAHADGAYASDVSQSLRRLGWDVYQAADGAELRRLARMMEPELVILDAELADESGWLTCAKLQHEQQSGGKVILVGDAT